MNRKNVDDNPFQTKYVIKHKQHHHRITLFRTFILIMFLLLWEFSSEMGFIDRFFFSAPSDICVYLLDMFRDKSFFVHTGITLAETVISFFIVSLCSIIFAILLWYYQIFSEISEPYLVVLNAIPKSALAPLLLVWLGTGMKTIIIAGISVAVFGSVISLYTGFNQLDQDLYKLIYTLGGNKRDILFKIVLPGSVPMILSNMKVNIGLSLVGVIIGEFLAARKGLGYLIIYGSQVFQLNMVITSIMILCFIAMLLYFCIQNIEHAYRKKQ